MNTVSDKYMKEIKKYLICPDEFRIRDIDLIKNDVRACLEENPDASYHDLELFLGPPPSVAESYLKEIPSEVLDSYMQKRRRKIMTVIVSFAAFIVLLIALVIYIGHMHSNFTVKNETVVYAPSTDLTSSSFVKDNS